MNAMINLLKGTAAIGAVALGLCFAATPASAEAKNTTNWNASSFGAACSKSPRCIGSTDGTKGQIYGDDGSVTNVRCSSNSCSYNTTPGGGGGSPARVAAPDKTLGTGVGLGGLLAGQSPSTPAKPSVPKTGPKVDTVYAPVDKPPKIEIAKPVKVDTPKLTTVPTKDIKVNAIR
jgi:hypothetical protein